MSMEQTLEEVADWARGRVQGGQEPPWTYYKLMQLIDAVEGLKGVPPGRLSTESSPQSPALPDSAPRPTGHVVELNSVRRLPD